MYGYDGRLNGEAEVDFQTHDDACEAMKYDKKYIGSRYIELFLQSGSTKLLSLQQQQQASSPSSSPLSASNSLMQTASNDMIPSLLNQLPFYVMQQRQRSINNRNMRMSKQFKRGGGGAGG